MMTLYALLFTAGQAAAQATEASRTGLSLWVDAGVILAALGALGRMEWVSRRSRRNGGPKPGETPTCRQHGEDIATLIEFKDGAKDSLQRIEGKVDRLLERT